MIALQVAIVGLLAREQGMLEGIPGVRIGSGKAALGMMERSSSRDEVGGGYYGVGTAS